MTSSSNPSPDPLIEPLLAEAGWVQALARRLARDQAAADDIAQSAMALAIEKRPSTDRSLRPWLATVVARLARTSARGEARRADREADRGREAALSECARPDEVLERFEQQRELARRVAALPDPYRDVLIRHYYDGASAGEIARATGVTASTARSQLSRGLERLRARYTQESGGSSALGVFLIASGQGHGAGAAARPAIEVLATQASTKLVVAAVAVVAASLWFIVPELGPGDPTSSREPGDVAVLDLAQESASGSPTIAAVRDGAGTRVTASAGTTAPEERTGGEALSVAVEADSVVRARILDGQGAPIQGARLTLAASDGQLLDGESAGSSDAGGFVSVGIPSDSIRTRGGEVQDITMAVAADEYATRFVVLEPEHHGEVNLGELRLDPGAVLIGLCVDELGRPVAGARLYATSSVLAGERDILRLTGPKLGVPRPAATSDSDGRFELRGVGARMGPGGAATARLWAHAPERLWTISDVLTVTHRARVDVGRVVLAPVPSGVRIEGVVRQPDGRPAPGAVVDYHSMSAQGAGSVTADEEGRFLIVPYGDAPMDLMARDPNGRFGMSASAITRPGDVLDLVLQERRTIQVTVTDGAGRVVPGANILLLLEGAAFEMMGGPRLTPGRIRPDTDENGQAEIPVPGERFSIEVICMGFESARVEAMEPGDAPRALTIELESLPGVSGQVLAYGEPVEGARITLGQLDGGFVTINGGFPNRFWSMRGPSTVTDADGRFTALLEREWEAVAVVARRDGLAHGEVAVRRSPGEAARGIVIEMTGGGVITGSVTPPPGMIAAGLFVAASRGDETPVSTRVDTDGRYRLEGLSPGRWLVEGRLREVSADEQFVAPTKEAGVFVWNAHVVDREALELDVDMRHLGDVELHGRLRVDGAVPPEGWTVVAAPPDYLSGGVESPAAHLDSDGRFVLDMRPGPVELTLYGTLPGGVRVEVVRSVILRGSRVEWEESLRLGLLEAAVPEGSKRARVVRGHPREGDRELSTVPVGPEGRVSVRVPLGQSTLEVPMKGAPFPNAWVTAVAEVTPVSSEAPGDD